MWIFVALGNNCFYIDFFVKLPEVDKLISVMFQEVVWGQVTLSVDFHSF